MVDLMDWMIESENLLNIGQNYKKTQPYGVNS